MIATLFCITRRVQAMSRRSVWVTGLVLAALITGLLVYGTSRATTRPAAAHPPAREAESVCVPVSVAVFNNRIHVECLNGAVFRYFAAPLGESNTSEFLTALTTAMSSIPIMELRIGYYDDTTSGPPFGCSASDCRKISYVVVGLKPGAPMN
jgi:hypothetical protein